MIEKIEGEREGGREVARQCRGERLKTKLHSINIMIHSDRENVFRKGNFPQLLSVVLLSKI